ncbi:protein canopy 4-like [Ptychodera flava]|uniref:protein canopy 4-like n=1 Tax=Ptychodera flava TaxID=63121 RepID=UPI00396A8C3B
MRCLARLKLDEMRVGSVVIFILFLLFCVHGDNENEVEREDPHREPTRCEVCKIFSIELQGQFDKSKKSRAKIEVGHQLDAKGDRLKRVDYHTSEMRFIEATENICEEVLKYNLHAERRGSRRFAKGMSETFQTLHGLVDKGVKVDLGIPYDMWDLPSAEITVMKKYCEQLMENHEEDLEEWYYHHQDDTPLLKYICEDRALKKDEQECLLEVWTGMERVDGNSSDKDDEEEKKKKKKSKSKKKNRKGENDTEEPRHEEL